MVIIAITMLFVLSIGQLGICWYFEKLTFINNGESRETVFLLTFSVTWWFALASDIILYIMTVLADALLVCKFILYCGLGSTK